MVQGGPTQEGCDLSLPQVIPYNARGALQCEALQDGRQVQNEAPVLRAATELGKHHCHGTGDVLVGASCSDGSERKLAWFQC